MFHHMIFFFLRRQLGKEDQRLQALQESVSFNPDGGGHFIGYKMNIS